MSGAGPGDKATRTQVLLRACAPWGDLERAVLVRAALRLAARTPAGRMRLLRQLDARAARTIEKRFAPPDEQRMKRPALPYRQWLERYQPVDAPSPALDGATTVAAVLCPGIRSAVAVSRCLRALYRQGRPAVRVLALAPTHAARLRLRLASWLAGERIEIVSSSHDLAGRLNADFVLSLRGAPLLRRRALAVLAASLSERPAAGAAYGDEDLLIDGALGQPFCKPDFSPILGRQYDYVGNVALFRAGFFTDLVAPDLAADGLPGWLGNPAIGRDAVRHVAEILHAEPAERRLSYVAGEAFDRALAAGARLAVLPQVAIVIPTKDHAGLLRDCIASVFGMTDYDRARLSVVIVDNGSSELEACRLLREVAADPAVSVIERPGAFNYAHLCNQGAAAAGAAEILVFMNNDVTIRDPEWLLKLVALARMPSTGVVGCKLLYPDGRVQHAGVIVGLSGVAGHLGAGAGADDGIYFGLANHTRESGAVTGALSAVEATLFHQVGGYDERMAVAVNDIALCLTCNDLGRQTLCLQSPIAFHHESASRGHDSTDPKLLRFLAEALHLAAERPGLKHDPFYSPHLSLDHAYELADPPRSVVRSVRERQAPLVLMLASTFDLGQGVAAVLDHLARALQAGGCTVLIGAPQGAPELACPAAERIVVTDHETASRIAVCRDVDAVIALTPPFFDVFRVLPSHIATIAYLQGDTPSALLRDSMLRRRVWSWTLLACCYADLVLSISEAVREVCPLAVCRTLPIDNRSMARWGEGSALRRRAARAMRLWTGQLVVFTVARFGLYEREVEGVDALIALRRALDLLHPEEAALTRFVLAGWGTREEAAALTACGLSVVADPSDEMLVELHQAADVYVSLGVARGYDFGIGQALAMGLPVLAAGGAAHPDATACDSVAAGVAALVEAFGDRLRRSAGGGRRVPVLEPEQRCGGRLRAEIDAVMAGKRSRSAGRRASGAADEATEDAAHRGRALQQPA